MEIKTYEKKPVEVQAVLFEEDNQMGSPLLNGIVGWINRNGGSARHNQTDIFIHTLEGEMRAIVGDYIIRGIAGEFYPCKPGIFDASYIEVKAA